MQSDGRTPADQINARFDVRVKNMAVDEPVTATLASYDAHLATITNSLKHKCSSTTSYCTI